jgi:hypothetical protein
MQHQNGWLPLLKPDTETAITIRNAWSGSSIAIRQKLDAKWLSPKKPPCTPLNRACALENRPCQSVFDSLVDIVRIVRVAIFKEITTRHLAFCKEQNRKRCNEHTGAPAGHAMKMMGA